jgi:hypothetical protein
VRALVPPSLGLLLTRNLTVIAVAMPDDALPPMKTQDFAGNGALLGGGHIGSKVEACVSILIQTRSPG